MPRYRFVPPRPDYPAASVAHFASAALTAYRRSVIIAAAAAHNLVRRKPSVSARRRSLTHPPACPRLRQGNELVLVARHLPETPGFPVGLGLLDPLAGRGDEVPKDVSDALKAGNGSTKPRLMGRTRLPPRPSLGYRAKSQAALAFDADLLAYRPSHLQVLLDRRQRFLGEFAQLFGLALLRFSLE